MAEFTKTQKRYSMQSICFHLGNELDSWTLRLYLYEMELTFFCLFYVPIDHLAVQHNLYVFPANALY